MPPGAFRDYVETVRSSLDIAQVVGEAVTLRKAGRSLVGLCPFHQERTPSFHVDPAKGLYYCFGCGAGGDAFRFVMEFHHVEFPEAVTMIGERLGISRPAPATAQEAQQDRDRRRALEALEKAQAFFTERLRAPDAQPARAYLARRGLDMEQARRFGLGYAPAAWDGLLRHLSQHGLRVEDILLAGLAVPRTSGEGAYDRFRNRVTFPIRDTAGRVVSFGGRALGDEEPKYLNGPETAVYDKGRTLFRLHEVARELRETRRAIVVEGYFDAVSLALVGTPGVVAVCGTAFGAAHARLVRRYAEQVVLLFDGDTAGRRAIHRALGPVLAEKLAVRVAIPGGKKDPDDLAREGGAAAVQACLDAALDLPHFLVEEAGRAFDLSGMEGRVAALEMVLGHLVHLDSPLARAEAIGRVADGLGIDDQLVRDELKRAARERQREIAIRPGAGRAAAAPRLSPAEAVLLRFLGGAAAHPEEADALAQEIPVGSLSDLARAVVTRWLEGRRAGEWLDFARLAEVVSGPGGTDILALAFAPGPDPDPDAVRGAMATLRAGELKARLVAVQEQIGRTADPEERDRLLRDKLALAREIQSVGAQGARGSRGTGDPAGGAFPGHGGAGVDEFEN